MNIFSHMAKTWREVGDEINFPKLTPGSVLRITLNVYGVRGPKFDHYGIYAGDGTVAHFETGRVRITTMRRFMTPYRYDRDDEVDVMRFASEHIKGITLEESYTRALAHCGTTGYDLIKANCEHFALWCRAGIAYSGQALGSHSETLLDNIETYGYNDVHEDLTYDGPDYGHWLALVAGTGAGPDINLPRLSSLLFNKLGMGKSRSIYPKKITDVVDYA
jgi:hypothetical protein